MRALSHWLPLLAGVSFFGNLLHSFLPELLTLLLHLGRRESEEGAEYFGERSTCRLSVPARRGSLRGSLPRFSWPLGACAAAFAARAVPRSSRLRTRS